MLGKVRRRCLDLLQTHVGAAGRATGGGVAALSAGAAPGGNTATGATGGATWEGEGSGGAASLSGAASGGATGTPWGAKGSSRGASAGAVVPPAMGVEAAGCSAGAGASGCTGGAGGAPWGEEVAAYVTLTVTPLPATSRVTPRELGVTPPMGAPWSLSHADGTRSSASPPQRASAARGKGGKEGPHDLTPPPAGPPRSLRPSGEERPPWPPPRPTDEGRPPWPPPRLSLVAPTPFGCS